MGHEFDQVEQRIQIVLSEAAGLVSGCQKSNTEWTRAMKDALCELGEDFELTTWAAGTTKNRFGEWLVDLVWLKSDHSKWGAKIERIELAMESEWLKGIDELLYDFQKLVAIKATHKLMIFEVPTGMTLDRFDHLHAAIARFQPSVPGERYLLAAWDDSATRFTFDLVVTS